MADVAGAAYLWSAWQERRVLLAEQASSGQHGQAGATKPDFGRPERSAPPL
jgi:hypothetical protein